MAQRKGRKRRTVWLPLQPRTPVALAPGISQTRGLLHARLPLLGAAAPIFPLSVVVEGDWVDRLFFAA